MYELIRVTTDEFSADVDFPHYISNTPILPDVATRVIVGFNMTMPLIELERLWGVYIIETNEIFE